MAAKKNTVIVEQYASAIRRPQTQRIQLKTLGLGRISARKELQDSPSVQALVRRLAHMVRIVG